MSFLKKLLLFAGPILLLLLVAIAGYAYSDVQSLSLPISKVLILFTIFLPLISGLSTQGVSILLRRTSNTLTLRLTGLIVLQVIYETAIATLALTHIVPSSTTRCNLQDRWTDLHRMKDGNAIRAIQDSFNCCGLNSVKHMAWPFGMPSTCAETYGRTQSCFDSWRKAEQVDAGILFLVAVVVFIMKILTISSLITNNSWARSRWGRKLLPIAATADEENPPNDARARMRRLIEDSAADENYRDEPDHDSAGRVYEGANGSENHGPAVMPSSMAEHGNEWRDEGQSK